MILAFIISVLHKIIHLNSGLKRWYALWCLKRIHGANKDPNEGKSLDDIAKLYMQQILQPSDKKDPKIIDEKSCESISFYGADQQGNSLWIKLNRRECRKMEMSFQLILSDGQVYVPLYYPDTTATRDAERVWSADDLRIEELESRKCWRIVYNGLLRRAFCTPSDDSVKHVHMNCLFVGHSPPSKWPDDWSDYLHANALGNEPWRDEHWIKKIKLLKHTGFDQWGSIIGQVAFGYFGEKEFSKNLYLRGLCQRRSGEHDFYAFHQIVTFLGVTTHGAMYYLGVSKTKHSFSHMCFGHILEMGGAVSKIDWTDLKLSDINQGDSAHGIFYKIAFKAGGKQYNTIIKSTVGPTICNNQHWMTATRDLRVELNNIKGVGLMITSYPSTGEIPFPQIVRRNQSTRSDTQKDKFTQKDKYILDFADKQCQNEKVVGGKGCSLALLTSIKTDDFVVPKGFCVTKFALERQLQHHQQLRNSINDIVDIIRGKKEGNLESYCKSTVSIIQSTPVEEEIEEAITEALKKLQSSIEEEDAQYAVRSSAVGEDSKDTSAAGQNATYLGVKANKIVENVAKCWASLYSYRSVDYRLKSGLPIRADMGVCVQKMIDSEAAGVMFTREASTGDPSIITINSHYGLGESVVSGNEDCDALKVRRKWNDTLMMDMDTVKIGEKKEKILLSKDGVKTNELSDSESKKLSISYNIAMKLAKIGLHLESVFESAQDVEWAVVDEQIYVLQSRPITTIYAWTDFELIHEQDTGVPCAVDLLTFANVGEVLPHPVAPLTISTLMRILNLSSAVVHQSKKKFDGAVLQMVGMRCALNYMHSLQEVSKEVTMDNKIVDYALCGKIIMTPEVHKIAMEKYGVISIQRIIYMTYNMFRMMFLNEKTVKRALDILHEYTVDVDQFDTSKDLYNAINKKYDQFYEITKYHNFTTSTSVAYQIMLMKILTMGSDDITDNHIRDISTLLRSCDNVISSQVPIIAGKIAPCISKCGKAEEFSKVKPAEALDWLKSHCPSAAKKLQSFFDKHGHRGDQEMDLYAKPWIFEPDIIINAIKTILSQHLKENQTKKALSAEETISSLKTNISWIGKKLLRFLIPLSRKAVMHRETTKNASTFVVHKLRVAYKRLGALMVAEGYIPDEDLIFFLKHQEIGRIIKNNNNNNINNNINSNNNALFVRKASRRKRAYENAKGHEYPEFSTGMPEPISKNTFQPSLEKGVRIRGTSVYPTKYIGRACVITDLSEATEIQKGDILITRSTDISWSPYFSLLGGIVTERGGLISHGAVVAREVGLPCIIGAENATKVFKTGDKVILNEHGTLELC